MSGWQQSACGTLAWRSPRRPFPLRQPRLAMHDGTPARHRVARFLARRRVGGNGLGRGLGRQMHYLEILLLEQGQDRRNGGGRRGVNVVQKNDPLAMSIEAGAYPADDGLDIARAPVVGINVDGKLRDISALQVGGTGV